MRRTDETDPSPENHRRTELASICAAAILRLRQRAASPESESPNQASTCLEFPSETVLSVQNG